MSAWNGAGTWEEKDMSAWMRDRVKEGLLALEGPESLKIDKVLSCSGEARLLHVRGKFRVGFELAVKVNWSAVCGGEKANGTLVIDEVTETDLDEVDIEVTLKAGPKGAAKQAECLAEHIGSLLTTLRDDILATANKA